MDARSVAGDGGDDGLVEARVVRVGLHDEGGAFLAPGPARNLCQPAFQDGRDHWFHWFFGASLNARIEWQHEGPNQLSDIKSR